ncbi:hypothetical protein Syun_008481 [Stephania yunnanensis]|uniref:Uncharacterized protein n=1 Tax=Stephania yunnanensis TaxID=152371 RepID=A0AAP0PN73_9MAGN
MRSRFANLTQTNNNLHFTDPTQIRIKNPKSHLGESIKTPTDIQIRDRFAQIWISVIAKEFEMVYNKLTRQRPAVVTSVVKLSRKDWRRSRRSAEIDWGEEREDQDHDKTREEIKNVIAEGVQRLTETELA